MKCTEALKWAAAPLTVSWLLACYASDVAIGPTGAAIYGARLAVRRVRRARR